MASIRWIWDSDISLLRLFTDLSLDTLFLAATHEARGKCIVMVRANIRVEVEIGGDETKSRAQFPLRLAFPFVRSIFYFFQFDPISGFTSAVVAGGLVGTVVVDIDLLSGCTAPAIPYITEFSLYKQRNEVVSAWVKNVKILQDKSVDMWSEAEKSQGGRLFKLGYPINRESAPDETQPQRGFISVSEKMRVFQLHLVLALPGKLWSALSAPSNLHDRDSTLFQPFDFPIHDLNWFFHEVEFFVDLDLVQWKW
ncbi:hypothetical protein LXL04_023139 [Taraxacum kok-saghyz]